MCADPWRHLVPKEYHAVAHMMAAYVESEHVESEVALLREFFGNGLQSFDVVVKQAVDFCPFGIPVHEVLDRFDILDLVSINVESWRGICPEEQGNPITNGTSVLQRLYLEGVRRTSYDS